MFRNFEYRTRDDFTVRYEEREVALSHLTGVDFYVSYWRRGRVGHTFLSFIFDNAQPLSISIETRPEVGEGFAPHRLSLQAIRADLCRGRRARHRGRAHQPPSRDGVPLSYQYLAAARARLLLIYLAADQRARRSTRVLSSAEQQLHDQHHSLRECCRTGWRFDIRHLLNGLIDGYLYALGPRRATTLPFDELRRRSLINEAAQAADGAPDFSERIRASLPPRAR